MEYSIFRVLILQQKKINLELSACSWDSREEIAEYSTILFCFVCFQILPEISKKICKRRFKDKKNKSITQIYNSQSCFYIYFFLIKNFCCFYLYVVTAHEIAQNIAKIKYNNILYIK